MRIRTSDFSFFAPANLNRLVRPLLVVLFFYWLARLAFVALYPQNFNLLCFSDWLRLVILSLRFDISALFTINLVFFPLLALPIQNRGYALSVKWLFVLGNLFFLTLNAIDVPFFAFNARRTSWDALLFLLPEFFHQLPQFLVHYWPVPIFIFVQGWLLHLSWKRSLPFLHQSWWKTALSIIFWLVFGVFLVRNSTRLKPLMPGEAFTLSQPEAGHGILNTPFLIFKTLEVKAMDFSPWLSSAELNAQLAIPPPKMERATAPGKGQNLVLIILESFATEYTGLEGNPQTFTPFLDSLAREGTWFPHHFSNGRTSRDALPSLFASVPSWMDESFVTSQYISIRVDALGHRLRRAGYETAFFHGGKNGTMSFDIFSKQAGFQQYFGLNEYPEPADFDGHWGIFDEPFLQFCGRKMGDMKPPFAAAVFTLSSHQPYTIPQKYVGRFPKGPLPVQEAIGYADYALKQFFSMAKRQPWFHKTLFVLTADHTQESSDPRYHNLMGNFDVPLVLFHPGQKIKADTSQWLHHLDLLPSLTDFLGLQPIRQNPLGQSLFRRKTLFPMQFQDGGYHGFFPTGPISWNGQNLESNSQSKAKSSQKQKRQMAACLQWYRRGLLRDSLFVPQGF